MRKSNMDAMTRSHASDSSVVSSVFNLRQLVWTELSSIASSFKEHLELSNNEHITEVKEVIEHNRSLTETLRQLREIIRGKDIEIQGLRRQLRSFSAGRPVCFVCGCNVATMDEAADWKNMRLVSDIRPPLKQRNSYFLNLPKYSAAQKRLRLNSSLSESLDSSATVGGMFKPLSTRWRPSGASRHVRKRPCVRTSNDLPIKPTKSVSSARAGVCDSPPNKQHAQLMSSKTLDTERPSLGAQGAFRMGELSPPTQQFDASLVIRNAVNHCDLAGPDATQSNFVASSMAIGEDNTTDDQSSITLSNEPRQSYKFSFQRPKHRSHQIAAQLIRQRLGLGLNSRRRRALRPCDQQKRNRRIPHGKRGHLESTAFTDSYQHGISDDTGADLTLLSGFLDSEQSMITTGKPTGDTSLLDAAGDTFPTSKKHLPSLGRSPTARSDDVFKRPQVPVSQKQESSPTITSGFVPVDNELNPFVSLG